MIDFKGLLVRDFSGGISDEFINVDPKFAKILENFFVERNGTLQLREGWRLDNTQGVIGPDNERFLNLLPDEERRKNILEFFSKAAKASLSIISIIESPSLRIASRFENFKDFVAYNKNSDKLFFSRSEDTFRGGTFLIGFNTPILVGGYIRTIREFANSTAPFDSGVWHRYEEFDPTVVSSGKEGFFGTTDANNTAVNSFVWRGHIFLNAVSFEAPVGSRNAQYSSRPKNLTKVIKVYQDNFVDKIGGVDTPRDVNTPLVAVRAGLEKAGKLFYIGQEEVARAIAQSFVTDGTAPKILNTKNIFDIPPFFNKSISFEAWRNNYYFLEFRKETLSNRYRGNQALPPSERIPLPSYVYAICLERTYTVNGRTFKDVGPLTEYRFESWVEIGSTRIEEVKVPNPEKKGNDGLPEFVIRRVLVRAPAKTGIFLADIDFTSKNVRSEEENYQYSPTEREINNEIQAINAANRAGGAALPEPADYSQIPKRFQLQNRAIQTDLKEKKSFNGYFFDFSKEASKYSTKIGIYRTVNGGSNYYKVKEIDPDLSQSTGSLNQEFDLVRQVVNQFNEGKEESEQINYDAKIGNTRHYDSGNAAGTNGIIPYDSIYQRPNNRSFGFYTEKDELGFAVKSEATLQDAQALIFSDDVSDGALVLNEPLYITGGVVENDPPPSCKYIHLHQDRAYYAGVLDEGFENEGELRQSKLEDLDSVPVTFSLDLQEKIKGLGSVREQLIAFCENGVYLIQGNISDQGFGAMTPQRLHSTAGCLSHNSIVETEDRIFWCGRDGIYMCDGFRVELISNHIRDFYQKNTLGERIQGVYDDVKERIYWTYNDSKIDASDTSLSPFKSASNDSQKLLVLNLYFPTSPRGCFSVFTVPNEELKDNIGSFDGGVTFNVQKSLAFFDNTLRYGGNKINVLDSELKSDYEFKLKNDERTNLELLDTDRRDPIPYEYESAATDFGIESVRKEVSGLDVSTLSKTDLALQATIIKDAGKAKTELPLIRNEGEFRWRDPSFKWQDPYFRWREEGIHVSSRKTPGKHRRVNFAAVSFLPKDVEVISGKGIIAKRSVPGSDAFKYAIESKDLASYVDQIGFVKNSDRMAFSLDNFTKKHVILEEGLTDRVVEFESDGVVDDRHLNIDVEFKIFRIPIDVDLNIISYTLKFAPYSDTNEYFVRSKG